MDRCPEHSESVALALPFLNMSIHTYTLCQGNALFPY
jgi:hypothetical protein